MLYNETHPTRAQEYLSCLDKNLKHPQISKIHIFYDTSKGEGRLLAEIKRRPVTVTLIKSRASFGHMFLVANNQYPDQKIILSNADIYFDETLAEIQDKHLEHALLAVTRLEPFYGRWRHFGSQRGWSQDVWIFKTPIMIPEKINALLMGTAGCDNYLAYDMQEAGIHVLNPCKTVCCFHMHQSKVRHWNFEKSAHAKLPVPFCSLPDVTGK